MSDDRLNRIENTLVQMQNELIRYNTLLEVHIEGVRQNRKHIAKVEMDVDYVTTHVHEVKGGMKLIKITGAILGVIGASLGILKVMGVI